MQTDLLNHFEIAPTFIQALCNPFDGIWDEAIGDSAPRTDVDMTPARAAALAIIASLQDRRGIKRGFEDIDEEVSAEIVDTLTGIIEAACDPAFYAHVTRVADDMEKAETVRRDYYRF